MHPLSDVSVTRKLKNVTRILKLQPKTIIIIGYGLDIPNDLQDLITVIQFSLPTETEIIHELTRLLNSLVNYEWVDESADLLAGPNCSESIRLPFIQGSEPKRSRACAGGGSSRSGLLDRLFN